MQWAKQKNGFTIVELLIVVVVIAILAAITIVAYNGIQNRADDSAAKSTLSSVAKKIAVYKLENNETYPASLNAAGISNSSSNKLYYFNDPISNTFCLSVASKSGIYAMTDSNTTLTNGGCAGTTTGALAWWPLNGNADDLSGNERNVPTISGMTLAVGQNGNASTAFSFNGSAQPNFTPITLTGRSFSVSGWIYIDAYNTGSYNQAPMLGQSSTAGGSLTAMHFGVRAINSTTDARVYMDYYASGQASVQLVSLSNWYHIGYTYNQANNTRTFYLNGAADNTLAGGGLYNGSVNTLGGSCCMNGGLRGRLDDVRLYNRVLTATEMSTLYNRGAL